MISSQRSLDPRPTFNPPYPIVELQERVGCRQTHWADGSGLPLSFSIRDGRQDSEHRGRVRRDDGRYSRLVSDDAGEGMGE